ncbi:glycosyltransferase family 32 protein [Pedobacter panaciterrae]|uniref:glycosyltransferase family 32 protein n=1 Tax=Pedobacter panaciterrae TaxID=363849 RepID=UPI0025915985|nr:glycosyltransferase [uncultured Pedobacter sp.]
MLPKKIHQIVGPNPSNVVVRCLQSWRKLEDLGYQIIYWDDDDLSKFILEEYPYAYESFRTARNHAEAADIARYLLVYHYGGYYVDWDIHLNNINLFLELAGREESGYLVIDPLNDTLASEHFAAPEKELYLLRIVDDIVDTFNRNERDLMNTPQYSGPYRMKYSLQKYRHSKQRKIPVKEIFEYSYDEIRSQTTFMQNGIMIHFWEHSWL